MLTKQATVDAITALHNELDSLKNSVLAVAGKAGSAQTKQLTELLWGYTPLSTKIAFLADATYDIEWTNAQKSKVDFMGLHAQAKEIVEKMKSLLEDASFEFKAHPELKLDFWVYGDVVSNPYDHVEDAIQEAYIWLMEETSDLFLAA